MRRHAKAAVEFALIGACVVLASCATPATPAPEYHERLVGCVKPHRARPVPQYGQGDFPGGGQAAKVARQDFLDLEGYTDDLEAATAGCLPVGQEASAPATNASSAKLK